MIPFLKKHSLLLSALLLLTIFIVCLFLPSAIPALGVICFLFTLTIAIAFIIEKHKSAHLQGDITREAMRRKITKDILILVITLVLAVLLGGVVSQLAASYAGASVEVRWRGLGMIVGFVAAILASFAVGFAVRWGVGKLSRE